MTTNHHTPITTGASANAANINAPLAELDTAISAIPGGDVTGPGASTDNAVALWDGIGGDTLQDSGVTIVSGTITAADIYVNSDLYGLDRRLINWFGSMTDHFRSGTIPTGYSWISDATFGGTPAILNYSKQNDYLEVIPDVAAKHFLAKSVSPSGDITLAGRFSTGLNTELGLRFDNNGNSEFGEVYATGAPANGTIRVDWRTHSGTTTTSVIVPAGVMVTIALKYIHSTATVYGYLVAETGTLINISSASVVLPSGAPGTARIGMLTGNRGNYSYCDWFYASA